MGEESPSRGIASRNFKTSGMLQPDKSSKEQTCSDSQSLKKKKKALMHLFLESYWSMVEPIIQSEVSQKETPIQYINAYIHIYIWNL